MRSPVRSLATARRVPHGGWLASALWVFRCNTRRPVTAAGACRATPLRPVCGGVLSPSGGSRAPRAKPCAPCCRLASCASARGALRGPTTSGWPHLVGSVWRAGRCSGLSRLWPSPGWSALAATRVEAPGSPGVGDPCRGIVWPRQSTAAVWQTQGSYRRWSVAGCGGIAATPRRPGPQLCPRPRGSCTVRPSTTRWPLGSGGCAPLGATAPPRAGARSALRGVSATAGATPATSSRRHCRRWRRRCARRGARSGLLCGTGCASGRASACLRWASGDAPVPTRSPTP
jgi:hypothetical protein